MADRLENDCTGQLLHSVLACDLTELARGLTFALARREEVGQGDVSPRNCAPLTPAALALMQLQHERPRLQGEDHRKGKILVPLGYVAAAGERRQPGPVLLTAH